MTIIEAIKEVMRRKGTAMTANEAYDAIVSRGLYEFHAQDPAHVVRWTIRRHSEGIDFPTSAPTKHFKLVGENRFYPLDEASRASRRAGRLGRRQRNLARGKTLAILLGIFKTCINSMLPN
jgi:restriction system protein